MCSRHFTPAGQIRVMECRPNCEFAFAPGEILINVYTCDDQTPYDGSEHCSQTIIQRYDVSPAVPQRYYNGQSEWYSPQTEK